MNKREQILSKDEIIKLLSVKNFSKEYYDLIYKSNSQSRELYGDKGYVFAQIGLNGQPCSVNCKFCSMGSNHFSLDGIFIKSDSEIIDLASSISNDGRVSDLFLMTTADFSIKDFIEIGKKVKKVINKQMKLVANIGDFGLTEGRDLKQAGFTGCYHIVRLGEGIDTDASIKSRENTISAILSSELDLYYCVEPIGPEHTYDQIADEIIRARRLGVDIMAVMRRTAVPGTLLYDKGEISIAELCKIAAVAALAVKPLISMNVHEPSELSLICGVNQLYAEIGANPRDTNLLTENSRGLNINNVCNMLRKYDIIPTLK